MKLIKSQPRYKCDFCKHTGIERSMKSHEKICWKNPDRYCETCKNTGYYEEDIGGGYGHNPIEECYYCKTYNENIAKSNTEYEIWDDKL